MKIESDGQKERRLFQNMIYKRKKRALQNANKKQHSVKFKSVLEQKIYFKKLNHLTKDLS